MQEELLQIRSLGVNFYVLRDSTGLYLIDGGFVGGCQHLRSALVNSGWSSERIVGIIITHGHLDHMLNIGRIAEDTGAWIAAPRLDSLHYEGLPAYEGASKVTGFLEAIGRPLFGFRKFTPTRLRDDGDFLDLWGGLTVVHLPGHTAGHSAFYSERRKLLFCSGLFASYEGFSHLPPRIFNSSGLEIPNSIATALSTALSFDLEGILPNHCDEASPKVHLERLVAMNKIFQAQQAAACNGDKRF